MASIKEILVDFETRPTEVYDEGICKGCGEKISRNWDRGAGDDYEPHGIETCLTNLRKRIEKLDGR